MGSMEEMIKIEDIISFIKELISSLLKNWKLILLTGTIIGGISFAWFSKKSPVYKSSLLFLSAYSSYSTNSFT